MIDYWKKPAKIDADVSAMLQAKMREAMQISQEMMLKNLSQSIYGDNALRDALYKPEKQTFWRKTKNKLRTAKERISNAWAALKGDSDYDY